MLTKLLPYQKKYILDDSKILVVEKGRQEGLTWVSPYKIMRRVFKSKSRNDHFWLSRDEFTGKQFVLDCIDWLRVYNIVAEVDIVEMKNVQTTRIKFENGCNLYVLSSSVDAVVGKRGHFYLDEFAVHKDQEALWNIALPCINWGFTITVISTHRSKTKFFNKLVDRIKKGEIKNSTLMTITIKDAVDDGLVRQMNIRRSLQGMKPVDPETFLEECRNNASTEEMFLQEYMCIPADSESSEAIKEEELNRVMYPKAEIFEVTNNGKYFIGIDVGRHRDLTSIWVMEDMSNGKKPMLVTRYIETMALKDFQNQESRIAQIIKTWKPRACMIDGTNTGAMLAENLAKKFSCCQSLLITAKTRPRYIGDAINLIRRETCKIPEDNDIYEDFLSVERYINKYGQVDYFIPSRADKGHGDRFMSFCLCVQAFLSKHSMAQYVLKSEGVGKEEKKPYQPPSKFINKGGRMRY